MEKELSNIIVDDKIFIIRGIQVMIDRDLADLYQVETKRLNEQVKRNIKKFPNDFMFQLMDEEKNELVAKCDRLEKLKHSTSNPFVFTEHGVYMLSTVLKSKVATDVSLSIMRTFVRLKNQAVPYFDIIKRLEKLETSDKETRELLSKVVQVVSNMQDIQNEAKEGTNKIGFVK
ncbi:MAG: ORF6N domain-containing protein [Arcobacter sp.]|uniref:ORF6N domain-containing protein n=2 Tax=Arcobacter TaxID=28196 RepID=UPI003C749646